MHVDVSKALVDHCGGKEAFEEMLAKEMANDLLPKLRDVNYVWPTPEQQKEAEQWRAEQAAFDQHIHELMYGDGSAEPRGILYAKGVTRCRKQS